MPGCRLAAGLLHKWEVSEMDQEIIKMAASQGFFAVLFVALLFYVLKTNQAREERLMACLEKLSQQYENLSRDVNEIKEDLKNR